VTRKLSVSLCVFVRRFNLSLQEIVGQINLPVRCPGTSFVIIAGLNFRL
jgi:hypothetical protein